MSSTGISRFEIAYDGSRRKFVVYRTVTEEITSDESYDKVVAYVEHMTRQFARRPAARAKSDDRA